MQLIRKRFHVRQMDQVVFPAGQRLDVEADVLGRGTSFLDCDAWSRKKVNHGPLFMPNVLVGRDPSPRLPLVERKSASTKLQLISVVTLATMLLSLQGPQDDFQLFQF